MNGLNRRWLPLSVLVAATGLLIASIAWTASAGWRSNAPAGPAGMSGRGMVGAAIAGDGPVRDLGAAKAAADRFARPWGLAVGEVMQFDNGFYAELTTSSGDLATEVLIDARTGDVQLEFGPAMMWNTAYGMHRGRARGVAVNDAEARSIADRWLAANRPGETAGDAELFPGYYTLHTMRGNQIVGMLSVNAATGAVWYHSWHGQFVAISEHDTD